jgi:hypothetical protein
MKISIHNNDAFEPRTHFHVRIHSDKRLSIELIEAMKLAEYCTFGGIAKFKGETVEVYDMAIEDDETGWACGVWNGIGFTLKPQVHGEIIDLRCYKTAEGDDHLDSLGFEEAMIDKLPDNFWIEPAHFIKTFLAAA